MKPTTQKTVLLATVLGLQSCITSALWGLDLDEDEDDRSAYCQRDGRKKHRSTKFEDVGLRILLTPVTLGLDLLTAPLQGCMNDDDEDCNRRRSRRCR